MKNAQNTAEMLRGIIPPVITPLRSPDEIDAGGLDRLVEHILAGGVHGLFLLGTTGEGPYLPDPLRRELVRRVCRQVGGRVPIYVGITHTVFSESIALAEFARQQGAQAVVAAPPYYLPLSQSELLDYVEKFLSRLPLPLVLYNIPFCTKIQMQPQTVRRLAELPGVIGLKDSSGDMRYFHTLKQTLRDRPDFRILMGTEELLAESLLLGADGGVSGGANLFPRLYVDLYQAALAADLETVRRLHQAVLKISEAIYSVEPAASGVLKGIKCALHLLGICSETAADPFGCFQEPQRERIRAALTALQKLCPSAAAL